MPDAADVLGHLGLNAAGRVLVDGTRGAKKSAVEYVWRYSGQFGTVLSSLTSP